MNGKPTLSLGACPTLQLNNFISNHPEHEESATMPRIVGENNINYVNKYLESKSEKINLNKSPLSGTQSAPTLRQDRFQKMGVVQDDVSLKRKMDV